MYAWVSDLFTNEIHVHVPLHIRQTGWDDNDTLLEITTQPDDLGGRIGVKKN